MYGVFREWLINSKTFCWEGKISLYGSRYDGLPWIQFPFAFNALFIPNWNLFCKTHFICPSPLSAPPSSIKFGRKEKQDCLLFSYFVALSEHLQIRRRKSIFCDEMFFAKKEKHILCWIGICLITSVPAAEAGLSHVSNIGAAGSRRGSQGGFGLWIGQQLFWICWIFLDFFYFLQERFTGGIRIMDWPPTFLNLLDFFWIF